MTIETGKFYTCIRFGIERLATDEEIQDMLEDRVSEDEYDGVCVRDGDYEGVTLQFIACGKNVSDFRISRYQAVDLIKHLAEYLRENV